jgi:Mn-dependent DtxR family transcriptional regulator
MEMVRSLDIEDHTKVVFHTRILKEAGIIKQKKDKSYFLTENGEKLSNVIDQSIISFSANSNENINL